MTCIVTNLWRDEIRKRRLPCESLEEIDRYCDSGPGPEALYELKEYGEKVQRALDTLAPEYKLVLLLRDMEGYSYQEIADMAELPLGTVKSRLSRARMWMRKKFQDAGMLQEP
jgi:RNA polymerase sigma-70 factor (ECF subfamily)